MAVPFAAVAPIDFHLHSDASDGDHPPDHIAAAARKAWLSQWALTDHDTTAGWQRIAGAPGLLCGVEITAGSDGREIHIVGLGIDPAHDGLQKLLAAIRLLRLERIATLLGRLPADVRRNLTAAEIKPAGADSVGRLHLARAITRCGGAVSIREVFQLHLADEHIADASLPSFPSIAQVAEAIRAAGGVAILAHPGAYRTLAQVEPLVDGLDGIEAAHPGLPVGLQQDLLLLAERRKLLLSVGSDTHCISSSRRPGSAHLAPELLAPLLERLRCRGVRGDAPE